MNDTTYTELIVRFLMFVISLYMLVWGITLCLEMDKLVKITNEHTMHYIPP